MIFMSFTAAIFHFSKLDREHAKTSEQEELYKGLLALAQGLNTLEQKIK